MWRDDRGSEGGQGAGNRGKVAVCGARVVKTVDRAREELEQKEPGGDPETSQSSGHGGVTEGRSHGG